MRVGTRVLLLPLKAGGVLIHAELQLLVEVFLQIPEFPRFHGLILGWPRRRPVVVKDLIAAQIPFFAHVQSLLDGSGAAALRLAIAGFKPLGNPAFLLLLVDGHDPLGCRDGTIGGSLLEWLAD